MSVRKWRATITNPHRRFPCNGIASASQADGRPRPQPWYPVRSRTRQLGKSGRGRAALRKNIPIIPANTRLAELRHQARANLLLQFRRRSPSPLHGLYYRRSAGNFFELHPSSRSQGTFLFFDEIQEVSQLGYCCAAHRRYRKNHHVRNRVVIPYAFTDVATEFRGRSIADCFRSVFREYARYHHALEDQQGMFDKNSNRF